MGAFYVCLKCDTTQPYAPGLQYCPKCGHRMTLEDAEPQEDFHGDPNDYLYNEDLDEE